jgi:tetratricopeptide (TPR) repeat protein
MSMPTLERAEYLYRLHRYPAAIEAVMEFLAAYPQSAAAHCILALCHAKEKRKKQAYDAAQSAIGYMPDWSHPHYIMALITYWFGDHTRALKALSEALRLEPNDADYHELLASIHYEKGSYRTSQACAEDGLAHDPEHVGCLYRLGASHYEQKSMKNAEEVFRNALRLDPEHAGCQGFLGFLENSRGNFHAALPLLQNALKENPDWLIVQDAWKESLRGSRAYYGVPARWLRVIDTPTGWLYLFLLFLIITTFVTYFVTKPGGMSGTALVGGMALAAGGTVVTVVVVGFLIHAYLFLVRLILLWRIRELKHSFQWSAFWLKYQAFFWLTLLILSLVLMIVYV